MKKLTLLMKNFNHKPAPVKIKPGTYTAADFARVYPKEYLEYTRAGMPAVNSQIVIT